MAVEDVPTQPTQQSTQSTQDASSQERAFTDSDIWGSLIPFNASNPHASRIDFLRSKHKYAFGRSRREGVNDISFPYFVKMSQRHCTIEWDGEETATSAVTVRDLNSSNGTFIGGRRLRPGEYQILRDWDVISFSAPCDKSTNRPRDDYRFFFRHMASRQRPKDGLYKYYDVQHVLGKGAYATVVKALHRMEGKSYAIKMFSSGRLRELLSSSSSSRGMKERMQSTATHLRREVHVLQGMDHPYICQLKEAFFEEFSVSVVLELVPGGDLMSYVIKREGLIEPEAQYFTYQICEGLAYVHGKGVVHRDLKPENVLLTDDHPPIVKIADFGLAKVIDSLSVMQTKCGTPIFIAPEVVDQSPEGYDKIVDSWSLGVMIYMMIARATPFHDDARDGPDWDLMREYEISDDGIDFIGRLLEYDPRRRMTPAQCLEHPWIVPQGRLQRARMLEREESFRRAAARSETIPSAHAPGLDEAGPPAGGAKRKAGAMVALGRSLSTLAVDVDDPDGGPPAAKRLRGEDGTPRIPDQPGSSATAWTPSNYDEVPGLGRWQSGSS